MPQQFSDSINIELVVTAVQMDKQIWMQGNLEILINGEKPYNESDIIDSEELFKSINKNGKYFIFSCCCGIPKCSNWEKGIDVIHKDKNIIWIDNNNKRSWTLSKERIENDLKEAKEEAISYKQFFENKDIEYVGFGYNL